MYISFKSDDERMQHAQARKIPLAVWDLIFTSRFGVVNCIREEFLELMKNPLTEFYEQNFLSRFRYVCRFYPEEAKLQLWLSMFYGHTELSEEKFMGLATIISLRPEERLIGVVITGKVHEFNEVFLNVMAKTNEKEFLEFISFVFGVAASMGHLSIMQRIIELVPNNEKLVTECSRLALINTASYAQLPAMDLIIGLIRAPEKLNIILSENDCEVFKAAASRELLEFIRLHEQRYPGRLKHDNEQPILNHQPVLMRLLSFQSVLSYVQQHLSEVRYSYYISQKKLSDIKQKYGLHNALGRNQDIYAKALRNATANNQIEDVRLILKDYPDVVDGQGPESKDTALHIAARRGYSDIVQLLVRAGASQTIENQEGDSVANLLNESKSGKPFEMS